MKGREYIEYLDTGENTNLTTHALRSLKRNGIHTVPQLKKLTTDDLYDWRNVGPVTVQNILDCLKDYDGSELQPAPRIPRKEKAS